MRRSTPGDLVMFLEPEKYNKQRCFKELSELLSDRCGFLHKIIQDLHCVNNVKHSFAQKKLR